MSFNYNQQEFANWLAVEDYRSAAAWLVRTFTDEVLGLCLAMVRDPVCAEDLTQDVFTRAFSGLPGFRGQASARTWILKIARNRCIDQLRSKSRDLWGGISPELEQAVEEQPDSAPLPSELLLCRDDVDDALAQLVEGDRALVVLRFRNGLDYSELALAFGLRQGTVRMRMSRALAKMRLALEAKHGEQAVAVASEEAYPQAFEVAALAAEPPEELEEDADELGESDAPVESEYLDEAPGAAKPKRKISTPPPPQSAQRTSSGARAKARTSPGFVDRLKRTLGMAPAATPSPPVEHPLTSYFVSQDVRVSPRLERRLLQLAQLSQ